jgi:nitrate reductase gamma subunit
MGGLVLVIFYSSIAFCIVTFLIKLYRYFGMPLPLRSEIYKGSSVYERADWWPRSGIGIKAKVIATVKETVTVSGYYRQNRGFWYVLYPFHLGIYMLLTWHVWLFVFPLVAVNTGTLDYASIWGNTATALVLIGALGILIKRLSDNKLRATYPRLHYLKWVFIILALGTGVFAVQYYFNGSMVELTTYVKQQLAFDMQSKLYPPLLPSLHVLIVAAVLVYLPFSHALRVFFRYYYRLRWDSVPYIENARVDKATRGQLRYPIVWSAGHVPADKNWAEL